MTSTSSTPMTSTSTMTMSSHMSLPHINLLISPRRSLMALAHHTSQQTRDEEENTIHDTKRKTGFEHGTRFIHFDTDPVNISISKRPEIDVVAGGTCQMRTVGIGDEAQLVHARDKGSHETEIDEGDEERVGARAVVREERRDGPGAREHRDDEQHQDVVGRQRIVGCVDVDEEGEHAECGDLWYGRKVLG
ncbi:hypothetical protein BOTNAR_0013g00440 [Botryotinia narcissicola]|uniref:Uncharacterized protein n=1 Tax=Botryotinia narcissicola TaxID=278944 RepID=A0A4Z1JCY1_9HELO|nr:hypothetical protein BOTNAR_0013g00440 [Botryotinia narcissicola]